MPAKRPEDAARSARLEARLHPAALALIKRAAEIQGRSLSDFVVDAARMEAQRAIECEGIVRLSAEEQTRFVEALLTPGPLSPALKRARAAHARLIAKAK